MESLSCFSQFQSTAFSLYKWILNKKRFSKISHSVVIFGQNRQNYEVMGVDLPPNLTAKTGFEVPQQVTISCIARVKVKPQ